MCLNDDKQSQYFAPIVKYRMICLEICSHLMHYDLFIISYYMS